VAGAAAGVFFLDCEQGDMVAKVEVVAVVCGGGVCVEKVMVRGVMIWNHPIMEKWKKKLITWHVIK
jgi:hypothetical protein